MDFVWGGGDLENSENVTATLFATPIIYLQPLFWGLLGGGVKPPNPPPPSIRQCI